MQEPLDQFIAQQLASGKYHSREELIEAALRLLQEHEAELDETADELRAALQDYLRGDRGVAVDMKEIKADEMHGSEQPAPTPKPIWEKIRETFSALSEEDLASLPVDGAAQVDHYAYGLPKR